jgi:hypothetical protein
LLEVLTDPHSIQWFLAAGGTLFVVGLGLLLWSLKVFEHPEVVATCLGLGSLAILAGGWALLALTRFQAAGRATMLLGCLVLPLNIWYYSTSGLMTEHFWVPATVCCAIYAFSAWRLRDPLFVPVLVAGITLTGMLILVDGGKFFEVATPAAFLVGLAFLCIHAERIFPEGEGPFSRRNFGMAFFGSGHIVLMAGLGLLLGGQIQGVLGQEFGWDAEFIPLVVVAKSLKGLALVLTGLATYLYLYSDLLVRHRRVYSFLGAGTLLWSEVLALDLFGWGLGLETIVLALAGTGLIVHLLELLWKDRPESTRSLSVFALLLNLTAVLFAVVLHVRVLNPWLFPNTQLTWLSAAALGLVAISSRLGAYLASGKSTAREWTYFFATGAATLMALGEALILLQVQPWIHQATWLMLLPVVYVVAARLYRGHTSETPLVYCGHLATLVLLACSVPSIWTGSTPQDASLYAAGICGLATVFYALNALWRERAFNVYLAALLGVATVWFGLHHLGFQLVETYTVAVAVAGLLLLLAYRLALVESWQPKLTTAVFQCGNLLTSVAIVAGVLQVVGKLMNPVLRESLDWSQVGYLASLLGAALIAAVLVIQSGWRRWYMVASIGTALVGLLTTYHVINLEPWRVAQLTAVGLGALILVASLVAWSREQAEQLSDQVDFGLLFGSLLVVLPLAIGVGIYRFGYTVSTADEIALLTVAMALFGGGFILRLKAPTLLGGAAVIGYLVMLIIYAHRFLDQLWIMGIYITVGGLLMFGIGLMLSLYRDWLLALPVRIRRGEGVWKVLTWR